MVRPLSVHVLVHWAAPFTSGCLGVLPVGTLIVATHDVPPEGGTTGFGAKPDTYSQIETLLVPLTGNLQSTTATVLCYPLDAIGAELDRDVSCGSP